MDLRRVVVTGLGALTPIGNDVASYWEGLRSGRSGAGTISRFDTSPFACQIACELKGYNAEDFFDRKQARKLDPFAQYAMVAADQAIADAGLVDNDEINRDRFGVIWSSGIGGLITFQKQVEDFKDGGRFNPFFIPKMIIDIASGHISMKHKLGGPNFAVVSACASSTNSMIDAFNYIRLGMADGIVTGGSEAAIIEAGIGGFSAMKAMSTRNDDPQTASRPFDVDRDGFVMGEGGGGLVLEALEHAQKRGAKIYAEIVGGGMSADAHHMTAPHPEGAGARRVMEAALKDAKMQASEIDYINVHGTSTPLGDIAETKAILQVFGEHAYDLNISATKSMTGHLLGAAGAIEAIACIKAIQEGVIPPTINHFNHDENLDSKLNLTLNQAQERTVNVALSNTFGFGGHNASVIFKKFES